MECTLPEYVLHELTAILEESEGTAVRVQRTFTGVCLCSADMRTKLSINVLFNIKLIVTDVNFINRRCGTMSKVFDVLYSFCKLNGISAICIQSVITYEMYRWCLKHSFVPDPSASIVGDEGFTVGDYILCVS